MSIYKHFSTEASGRGLVGIELSPNLCLLKLQDSKEGRGMRIQGVT